MGTQWHVLLVWSGQEATAFDWLGSHAYERIWPRWKAQSLVRGKAYDRMQSMATGYILVRFDGHDARVWHDICEGCDALGFIGGERPTPVREEVVSQFLSRCVSADGLMELAPSPSGRGLLIPGWRVRLYGLWEGRVGTVRWDDNRAVHVTMEMLGREVSLYLPYPDALALEVVDKGRTRSPQFGPRRQKSSSDRPGLA